MRLWHKDLIPVLPRQQLLAQWRECCCIARNIAVNGTPNHLLVNKVMEYPIDHFIAYAVLVRNEMKLREYKCEWENFRKYFNLNYRYITYEISEIFPDWHNNRYLEQCYFNLQEKYDCGGITYDEWITIEKAYFHY